MCQFLLCNRHTHILKSDNYNIDYFLFQTQNILLRDTHYVFQKFTLILSVTSATFATNGNWSLPFSLGAPGICALLILAMFVPCMFFTFLLLVTSVSLSTAASAATVARTVAAAACLTNLRHRSTWLAAAGTSLTHLSTLTCTPHLTWGTLPPLSILTCST